MKKGLVVLATAALLVMGVAGLGHATISGEIWQYDISNDASVTVQAGPHAQFDVSAINFDSSVNGFTTTSFLGNPTFTNQTAGLDNLSNTVNFDPSLGLSVGGFAWGSHITFTGKIYLTAGSNTFTVRHDDGVVLAIDTFGIVINSGAPTPAIDSSFTIINPGAASLFAYTLDYNEANGAPAVLEFPHSEVPLPPTILLLGSGLLGLAGWRRFRKG